MANMIRHMGTVQLETKSLLLRRMYETDAEEICGGYINQDEFLYYANKAKVSLEQEKAFLKLADEWYEDDRCYNWCIVLKESGAVIGGVNLRVDDKADAVEFNYAIDNRFTGNGYMTEALGAVRDFCLDELSVKRFQGACCVENIASRKVMEKCGLRLEKVLEKHIELRDGPHGAYLYSLTK